MRQFWLICSIFLCFINICMAGKKVVCKPPQGLRIDYYNSDNIFKRPHGEFLTDSDSLSGVSPTISFGDDNKTLSFMIGNSSSAPAKDLKGNMTIIFNSDEQITFTGIINGAPVMGSYYQRMNVLVFDMQSDWLPTVQGVRATSYYSKCSKMTD